MLTEESNDFRPIMNSLYDPMFEGLGLPVDPHLRLFAKYKVITAFWAQLSFALNFHAPEM